MAKETAKKQYNYVYYGTKCNSTELQKFIAHNLEANEKASKGGRKRTPVCIWGTHGIGKTQIVESVAKQKGYDFVYIAPAQFEEMGDLLGMPKIDGQGNTVFAKPEWVPEKTDKPGILLIDDVNRADDRILRGIMQLLQNYELISWKLPDNWDIVLTANPDGGDYSVTPMDNAMITRMMHVTLVFEVKQWARWAESNGIDSRGINFVLAYPEIVTGERTTPRTLVQFFEAIHSIEDLSANMEMVKMLADGCFDEATTSSFISFVTSNMEKLISPEEIIDAENFEKTVSPRIKEFTKGSVARVDIISIICTRLTNYMIIKYPKDKLSPKHQENLIKFLKLEFLPNDLRITVGQDLVNSNNPALKFIMADKEVGKMLLQKM